MLRWRHLRHMDDTTRDELLATSMQKAVRALAWDICTGLSITFVKNGSL
jgi:hypothetical protein